MHKQNNKHHHVISPDRVTATRFVPTSEFLFGMSHQLRVELDGHVYRSTIRMTMFRRCYRIVYLLGYCASNHLTLWDETRLVPMLCQRLTNGW